MANMLQQALLDEPAMQQGVKDLLDHMMALAEPAKTLEQAVRLRRCPLMPPVPPTGAGPADIRMALPECPAVGAARLEPSMRPMADHERLHLTLAPPLIDLASQLPFCPLSL